MAGIATSKGRQHMKVQIAVAATCVVGLVGAGSVFAGERTGSGKPTPVNNYTAKSFCAFSGLEDNDFESPVVPGVTQNWGQIVKVAGPLGGAADVGGDGCNAHKYPAK
jgi:hypothetical protein